MHSVPDFIECKLGLRVNATKTKIVQPDNLKYLGFGFWKENNGPWKACPYKDFKLKFQRMIKRLCRRSWSVDLGYRISKLNEVTRGWVNYYRIGNMKTFLKDFSAHLRTMLRIIIWKQWKVPSKRQWGLQKLGVCKDKARQTAYMGDHYQFVCTKTCVMFAISKEKLARKGLVDPLDCYLRKV